MNTEEKFRELLLPILGYDTIEEIPGDSALVNDLGADSIDFVEIMYVIETNFGIVLKTNELISGGLSINQDDIFNDGCLTAKGLEIIENSFPNSTGRYKVGMNKIAIFSTITVHDLASIIDLKIQEGK
jgi:acyl carrier protein